MTLRFSNSAATAADSSKSGLSGRLLISLPGLVDPPFDQAVVLVCTHDTEHAFGVIVNKPIDGVVAQDAVKNADFGPSVDGRSVPIFLGGPCDQGHGFVLHTDEYHHATTFVIAGNMGLTANRDALEHLDEARHALSHTKLIAGHAGWSAGQLDDELRRNLWLDLPASHDLIFETSAKDMWSAALAQIGLSPSNLAALASDGNAGTRPLS
ncbi:YqgE/AlgH family protein [Parvularcula sp. LCG005]|uniref:YqgE/AlgH family protein n=1 Tax=Parvularcula sp. LCG005 TaxID=3078805 RepID=UPI0029429C74|nr:YqgE/AlgH family protein [Parvularcula sp. LCG005]WOI53684.1 YqgE/AlgH family protein [Parvularcula sp. LCG005]